LSPWWLRPPGDESDEPSPATSPAAEPGPEPETEMAESEGTPSIADLLSPGPGAAETEAETLAAEEAEEAEGEGGGAPSAEGKKRRRRPRRRGGRGGRGGAATAAEEAEGEENNDAGAVDDEDEEDDYESLARELMTMTSMPVAVTSRPVAEEERKIAMFCDLENVALGVRDSEVKRFDIHLVLERLLEKGKIIVKRAYADWERYSEFKVAFHEAAIELIDIPQRRYTGKNSADIKMVVDAMDLCYAKEHLDTFVILSGDSDFSPLVSKLKENNKYVIGIGVKNSSSNLLVDNCDEFIYYEDVWRDREKSPELTGLTKKKAEAFSLMVDAILALQRENKDVLWGSMIKQTMQRKKPSFNEGYYGYSTFTELLQDAERHGLIRLKKDQRSGTWVVTGFAKRK
jgi:uncharacterized protein (TIGR00288 family)